MANIQQYQSHVLAANEFVDYASMARQSYPPQSFRNEPFIGLKILLRDPTVNPMDPVAVNEKLRVVDSIVPTATHGRGLIVRESDPKQMTDALWIITMPVPRSQMPMQIRYAFDLVNEMEQRLGFQRCGLFEINVSGFYPGPNENLIMAMNSSLAYSEKFKSASVPYESSPYRFGTVKRISNEFAMLRTRWDLGQRGLKDQFDDVITIASLICSSF